MNNKFYAQIEVFVTVVRCGSFTEAAMELKTTKSNVSQKLSDLEALLNVTLLERTTRQMELTPAGERAYEMCQSAVDETVLSALNIGALFNKKDQLSGCVRLSGSNTYLTKCVLPKIPAFRKQYPEIEIVFIGNDRRVDFAAEDVDMGFRIGPLPKTRDRTTPLKPLERILCLSPEILESSDIFRHPSDLVKFPCIRREQEQPVWSFQQDAELYNHHIHSAPLLVNSVELSLEAAINGLGVCLIAEVVARDAIKAGNLVQILGDWNIAPISVHLVIRHSRINRAYVDVLHQYLIRCL